jgi:cytidine deaminase
MNKIPVFIEDLAEVMVSKRSGQIANPDTISLFNHMCAILNNTGAPLIFASNFYNIPRGSVKTTSHAEATALSKLAIKMGRVRRKITVDILVIRTNMGMSMPCSKCMQCISDSSQRFHIRNIYYTNNGKIDRVKFSKC